MIFCSPEDERRSNQNHFSFKSFTNIRRPYPSLSAFRSTPVNMVLHVLSIRQTSVVMLRPWTCVQHYSHQLTKFWWFISFICYDLHILWSKHRDSTIPSIHINPTSQCTWCSSSFGLKFRYFLMLPRRPGRCHCEAAMLRDNHRIWVKSKNLEEFTKMNWNLSGGWGPLLNHLFLWSRTRSFGAQTWYTRTSSMEPKKKYIYI